MHVKTTCFVKITLMLFHHMVKLLKLISAKIDYFPSSHDLIESQAKK